MRCVNLQGTYASAVTFLLLLICSYIDMLL